MRTKLVTILKLSPPHGLPASALRAEVGIRWSIVVGDLEFETALSELRDNGWVLITNDELTGDRQVEPTAKLRAR